MKVYFTKYITEIRITLGWRTISLFLCEQDPRSKSHYVLTGNWPGIFHLSFTPGLGTEGFYELRSVRKMVSY